MFSFWLLCSVLYSDAETKYFRLFGCKGVGTLVARFRSFFFFFLHDSNTGRGECVCLHMCVWWIIHIGKTRRYIVNAK